MKLDLLITLITAMFVWSCAETTTDRTSNEGAFAPAPPAHGGSGSDGDSDSDNGSLAGSAWRLAGNERITLRFSEQRLSGSSGCNRYFSSYRAGPGGRLRVDGVGSSRKSCAGDVMDRERDYQDALRQVDSYQRGSQRLRLYYAGGVLEFVAQ